MEPDTSQYPIELRLAGRRSAVLTAACFGGLCMKLGLSPISLRKER